MSLKYLFIAIFKDGSSIIQTEEDISTIDSARSAFFDVLQRENELKEFMLKNKEHSILVNLEDGHFEIDNVNFKMHDTQDKLTNEFRLIFFRRHKHEFIPTNLKETKHQMTFRLGWQCLDIEGKNIQRVLEII